MQEQILEQIGPFTGVNTKSPARELQPGKSTAEANLESYIAAGAWMPIAGRSFIFSNSTSGGSSFRTPIVGIGKFPTPSSATNYVIATGPGATSSGGAQLVIWNGTSLTNLSFGSLASPIGLQNNVRMVQYQNFMFMSGLQTGLNGIPVPLVKIDTTNTITEWQLPAPTQAANVGAYFVITLSGSASGSTTSQAFAYGLPSGTGGTTLWSTGVNSGQSAATIASNIISSVNSNTANTGFSAQSGGTGVIVLYGTTILPTHPNSNMIDSVDSSIGLGISAISGVTISITTPPTLSGSYYYRYTYQNSAGTQESSPSPVGLPASGNQGSQTIVSGPIVYGTVTVPSSLALGAPTTQTVAGGALVAGTGDPNVATINLYRLGGTIGQWTFVGSVANPGAGRTAFIIDTAADASLTGQNLVLHRDVPPPFNDIFLHKDRLWGFGENQLPNGQGNLWFSNYKEPWSWDNVNQVIPVGQAVAGDVAVAGCSLGSIALLLKQKTAWVLYGDSPVDFLVRPAVQNVGCGAQFSLVVGEGIAYWLSPDARVYSFDGNSLQYLSNDIQTTLSALTPAQISQAQGAYYEQKYYLSIPALNATYYYDTTRQEWHVLTITSSCFEYDPPARELWAANPSAWEVDSWFTGSDSGVAGGGFAPSYTSRIFGDPWDSIKQLAYLQVYANATPTSYPVTFNLICNPTAKNSLVYPQTYSVVLDLANGNQVVSLPASMTGREFQLQITGPSNATNSQLPTIEMVILRGWVRRKVKPQDE